MIGTFVRFLNKENVEGVDFYKGKQNINFKYYCRRDWRASKRYIYFQDMENTWQKQGGVYTVEENRDKIVEDIRNTILQELKIQKKDKEAVPRCKAYHFRLSYPLESGHDIILFDTMDDAPKYWKETDEELERVVRRIKIEDAINYIIECNKQADTRDGYVEDEGTLILARVIEGIICVEQWNNDARQIMWVPYAEVVKKRAAQKSVA